MDEQAASRVAAARVGRLATVRPDGRPHVVPVVFALVGGTVATAVDAKPKRTHALQRLRNLEQQPACSLLVDVYAEDWSQLWWVRLDGVARVVRDEPERSAHVAALVDKYAQYRSAPPSGPVVVVEVTATASWSAS